MPRSGSAPSRPPVERRLSDRKVEETKLSHLSWNEICERMAETARRVAQEDQERVVEQFEVETPPEPLVSGGRSTNVRYGEDEIQRAWEQTGSASGTARILGCTLKTVYGRLYRLGLLEPLRGVTVGTGGDWNDDDVRAAWAATGTVNGTARYLGCAVQTARKHVDRLGLRNSEQSSPKP